ncbi:hypothetical protein GCM10009001_08190 [Virgibacillus siamensis]|uniref:Heavy metal translocating P-type ATPase n=1 Tax=Virgibacillus siamensis TaxID=480071 RepID=A0ABN1FNE1_9BACI
MANNDEKHKFHQHNHQHKHGHHSHDGHAEHNTKNHDHHDPQNHQEHSNHEGHDHGDHDHHDHGDMVNEFKKRFYISVVVTIPILILSPMIQVFIGVDWQFCRKQEKRLYLYWLRMN